jgi:hypothetical protein
MSDFDNRGQVALWKKGSDNDKAPVLSGSVVAHRDIKSGETLDIALWKNDSENENAPVLKGKISDKFQKESNGFRDTSAKKEFVDNKTSEINPWDDKDDLPF